MIPRLLVAVAALVLGCASFAAERDDCKTTWGDRPTLCAYEPNTIGYTNDSDDVGFMDFKISIRYQLFPGLVTWGFNHVASGLGDNTGLFFAFTGRFGQYIGTRESAPVIGKRFNPKLFFRHWTDERKGYLDFTFLAHESNGQSIDSQAEYQAAQSVAQHPEFVNDHISRGWDYVELVWKKIAYEGRGEKDWLATYVNLKYFLPDGPLQGKPEEYNTWENHPEGKPRNHVNGVAAMLKYVRRGVWIDAGEKKIPILSDLKLAAAYETGYREIFQYSTVRFEIGTRLMDLPLNLWTQRGYNSDLAQYYKKVTSWGIEMQIGSF